MQNTRFFIGQNMQLCDVLVAEVAYGPFFILLVINEQSWPGTKILHYAREIGHPTLMVTTYQSVVVITANLIGHYLAEAAV